MCTPTIIDSNSVGLIVPRRTGPETIDRVFKKWLGVGYGVLCYTSFGKLGQETDQIKRFKQALQAYKERGIARLIPNAKMKRAQAAEIPQ